MVLGKAHVWLLALVFTKPWTLQSSLMLRDGTRLEEFVCAENNIDPERYEKLLKDGVKFTR